VFQRVEALLLEAIDSQIRAGRIARRTYGDLRALDDFTLCWV
jgi:hypothetical protein